MLLHTISIPAPCNVAPALATDPVANHPPLQRLPEPLLPATALANPPGDGMFHPVAPLADTANLACLCLPNPIVIVSWANDGVGNFVQDGVLDFRPSGRHTVAHRQINPAFVVAANPGPRRRQVKAERPPALQSPAPGELIDQAQRNPLHFGQRTLNHWRAFHLRDGGVRHRPLAAVLPRHVGVPGANAGDLSPQLAGSRPSEPDDAPDGSLCARKIGRDCLTSSCHIGIGSREIIACIRRVAGHLVK